MAAHERKVDRAEQRARRAIAEIGRELRMARLNHDLSQRTAAQAIGVSHTTWGRMERGFAAGVVELSRACSVVGLDLHVRAYPSGSPLRDAAHVRLLEQLRRRISSDAGWLTEVPLPHPGDRRAWDALIRLAGVRIGVEAETRARDAQELERRINAKRRDGQVDHVILLLADTRHNRAFLRSAGAAFLAGFEVEGRVALSRLAGGLDPGGSAIVLLPIGRRAG